jgi:hypothetical protein
MSRKTADMSINAWQFMLRRPGGNPNENVMYFASTYANGTAELRLVRQIPRQ